MDEDNVPREPQARQGEEALRKCDLCGSKEAIYRDHVKGISICADCLMESVKRRAWSVLEKELIAGERIMVAHSGGKDSSLALVITKEFVDSHPDMMLSLISVTVDEGTLYRRASIELARKLAEQLGVKHRVYRNEEIHGLSIEELDFKLPANWKRSACTYCGVLRRQALNAIAREIGATAVVTGHNLDDVVQTALMNMSRGDVNALARTLKHERRVEDGLIPRVRPLKYVYEREIAALVVAKDIPAHLGKCPFTQGMRIGIRKEVDDLEDLAQGSKVKALETFYLISKDLEADIQLRRCKICGEPTTSEICKACQFKKELSVFLGRDLVKPLNLERVKIDRDFVWG